MSTRKGRCFGNIFLKYLEIFKYLPALAAIAPNIQSTNLQSLYCMGESRFGPGKKQVPNFIYYNHLRRSKLPKLTRTSA